MSQIVFIGANVSNFEDLILSIDPTFEIVVIDSKSNGILQMADALANRHDIDSLHIISHGSSGLLTLGATVIDQQSLQTYRDALKTIGNALSASGDILLYGCDVAKGESGQTFISALSDITGADIASSTNLTGAISLGGDWALEFQTGVIEAATISPSKYQYLLPADTTPPTLINLSFPSTIDVSSGSKSVEFGAQANDASGISQVVYWFDKKLVTNIGAYSLVGLYSGWDDATPNQASDSLIVSTATAPGTYNITSVDVKDKAGNVRTYTTADLLALGQRTSFTVSDGIFVPNSLTATVSTEPGKIILSISTAQWSAANNSLNFALNYDSSVVHFDTWRSGGSGSYSASSSASEVGASGTLNFTSSINNGGDKTDFIQLIFTTSEAVGKFAYTIASATVNAGAVANITGSYQFALPLIKTGSALVDTLIGGAGDDTLSGGAGNDFLTGAAGNDFLDGGAGLDSAIYSGLRSNFTVNKTLTGFSVIDKTSANGTDTLINLERLLFSDVSIALDISGTAGQAYRLYQAAFGRKPDLVGLGYWIKDMDKGSSLTTVAAGFFQSPEFQKLYGNNPTTMTLITNFYQNVLHRAPDQAGFDYWANEFNTGKITPAGALASFCESTENQALVIGAIQNGIEYSSWLS